MYRIGKKSLIHSYFHIVKPSGIENFYFARLALLHNLYSFRFKSCFFARFCAFAGSNKCFAEKPNLEEILLHPVNEYMERTVWGFGVGSREKSFGQRLQFG